jgi:succinylarginine dihydrolase
MREYNFDGIVGLTHNYSGLSTGNLASTAHAGQLGSPRAAVLQGLDKMRFVASLGVGQAVLPPPLRPDVATLRRLGFTGDDGSVLRSALRRDPRLLQLCSSASAMWAANAATVAPSADAADARVHLTPANLTAMFHRNLEVEHTTRLLRRIFADSARFKVHDALPGAGHFSDEGAANHIRLVSSLGSINLFGWGRSSARDGSLPTRYPARQTLEASQAIARLHQLDERRTLFWQQAPLGIDQGAFHSDVLAVGHENLLLLHEHAFSETPRLIEELSRLLGGELQIVLAGNAELPLEAAVGAYPFNSQLVTLGSGKLGIIAPREAEQNDAARRYLERVLAEPNAVEAVHYVDVNASMHNGGGPACLRLRVLLTDAEHRAVGARVFLDAPLHTDLRAWAARHYRDRLTLDDLADPALLEEGRTALDELSALLRLGSVYDFQSP